MKTSFPFFYIFIAALTMTGCSTLLNNLPGVYTVDVQQGNVIEQDMVDQLKPNMTKRQVLYIMGSPMLQDSFHRQRWDYIYSNQPGGEPREQKQLTLIFQGDRLSEVRGDFQPSGGPAVEKSKEITVEVPKRQLEKTMWEKITSLFGSEPDIPVKPRKTVKKEPERRDSPDKVFDEPF